MRTPNFTENGRRIFDLRYPRKGEDGQPAESPAETIQRVAENVAIITGLYAGIEGYAVTRVIDMSLAEVPPTPPSPMSVDGFPAATALRLARQVGLQERTLPEVLGRGREAYAAQAKKYGSLIADLVFLPNSPTWTGAGTPLGQLAACFVLPISDDLGREDDSIFATLRNAALIQQTGGGNGFSFSSLRPENSTIVTSMGKASGPMGFLRVYNGAFGEIAQGGSRRGANMGVLIVNHPDIRSFIRAKVVEGEIANFNLSVAITDDFMDAVAKGDDFDLTFGDRVYETVPAKDLYDEIIDNAWVMGDPGNLFIDRANRDNPCPTRYRLEATNPCVTGDSLVATPAGWRRVDEIEVGDPICTVLGEGAVKEIEVHESVPVYEVRFSDGGVVKATAAHQFHVRDSRTKFFEPRRLDETEVGQWVRIARGAVPDNAVPSSAADLEDRDFGFLIGLLVGDGCYTEAALSRNVVRVSSHADEHEWNDVIRVALEKIGCTSVSSYTNAGSRSLMLDPKPGRVAADWVKSTLLVPAKSIDKALPNEYVNSNRDFLLGLLDGLFSTDGSIDLSSNHPLVRFHTGSESLAKQVRLILLSFGIHGRVCRSKRREHEQADGRVITCENDKFDVIVSGESFGRFAEQVTLSHPDKQARINEARLRCNFTGGNWAAKIVSIEPAGVERVYDLYEPESDTWNVEGYIQRGCGEQWLGPYENCCLGSIAIQHFAPWRLGSEVAEDPDDRPSFDWDGFRDAIRVAVEFLDDVVDANQYVPDVPALADAAWGGRRIGLGLMGVADAMAKMGIRYGSEEGLDFLSQVTEFARYHAMVTSIERAQERGPFAWIQDSVYDPALFAQHGEGAEVEVALRESHQDYVEGATTSFRLWSRPTPLVEHRIDFGRPFIDWDLVAYGIRSHGIRNSAQFTFAPTGTISNVAGCEGSGCEPFFALAFERTVMQEGENLKLAFASDLFAEALRRYRYPDEEIERIAEEVAANGGSCQDVEGVPGPVRHAFVVAADISPEEHVWSQAALQAWVDNSISKTINMPHEATREDVARAYRLAFDLGCKGITIYRQGSRDLEVLSTKRSEAATTTIETTIEGVITSIEGWPEIIPLELPPYAPTEGLAARVYPVDTFYGKVQVTVTELDEFPGRPFDIRLQVGKAGNDTNAHVEALGRIISLALRAGVHVGEIVKQLEGIGGANVHGFGQYRVRSVADGVAKMLRRRYLTEPAEEVAVYEQVRVASVDERPVADTSMLCPQCGNASLVMESGCRHCDIRLGGCGEYSGCD